MKSLLWFILTAMMLAGSALALFYLQTNLFFALLWMLIFAAVLTAVSHRLPSSSRMIVCAAILLGGVWYLYNDTLLQLISAHINSNPYGDYILSQFEFRLSLSIFILKIIKNSWLTDSRLLICGILMLIHLFICRRLIRLLYDRLPGRLFEFCVTALAHMKIDIGHYLASSVALALLNSALWCLAGFLLQFDNFILMMFIMFICAFIPRIGLFIAALLSLLFVESGLFLIQIGGLLIAVALIWFVDHILLQDQQQNRTHLPATLLLLLLPASYAAAMFLDLFIPLPADHPFLAFFLAAPVASISAIASRTMQKYASLIHKIPRQTRNG
ncbi:hypothetical protein JW998_16330 [candidate division KSB1 bacterium]|nr:hypothetical protein [candidate division KSB1 bacterium]